MTAPVRPSAFWHDRSAQVRAHARAWENTVAAAAFEVAHSTGVTREIAKLSHATANRNAEAARLEADELEQIANLIDDECAKGGGQ